MNLAPLDWLIFGGVFAATLIIGYAAQRHVRGVADFLAAGRSAGRYLLSVGYGIALVGAISIVGNLEMGSEAGFATGWWGIGMATAVMVVRVTGWVTYRFRRTRCLTLAEFFERRYSRGFRVFAGLVAFGAGIVNFGIFPSVGAHFFIVFLGLPDTFVLGGASIETFPCVMAALLLVAVGFVFAGGQVTVLVTDFVQGTVGNIVYVVLCVYLLLWIGWPNVVEVLSAAEPGHSRLNPFDTEGLERFNPTYFLIGIVGLFYNAMSWQGTQAYNSSARTAHEGKMGLVLDLWRMLPYTLVLALLPVLIYTVLQHPGWSDVQQQVASAAAEIENPAVRSQMRSPLVLAAILPRGLLGAFAAFMLGAFISTHNTYLHSWGSILIQDVVLPLRGRPLSPRAHLRLLRGAIVGVAVFIFCFSLWYRPTQAINLFFALTGAIFAGWSGAVIIGGLYTRWGQTSGAWAAGLLGVALAVLGLVMEQARAAHAESGVAFWGLLDGFGVARVDGWARYAFANLPNGQQIWGLAMPICTVVYAVVSLLSCWRGAAGFDLDRLLHRGRHRIAGEVVDQVADQVRWNLLAFTPEFSRFDKAIYVATYIWHAFWLVLFALGTTWYLLGWGGNGAADDANWVRFWWWFVWIHLGVSVVIVVWFTVGGIRDVRRLFRDLASAGRDDRDDGVVRQAEE